MRTPTNVFYTFVAFAFIWKVSLAYPPYGDVEIVNGKCKWQNYLVPDGESLNLENPCQTWQCNVEDRSFAVLRVWSHRKPVQLRNRQRNRAIPKLLLSYQLHRNAPVPKALLSRE
uniref:Putative secreted protein n=1 Tax=Ixodes ricinus TaxID=34613 RepID=V5GN32_IXORI